MGLFDTLHTEGPCPFCNGPRVWEFQYKYGDCNCNHKRIGDPIEWSGSRSDFGPNVGGTVAVDGLDECPSCLCYVYARILIRDNRLIDVTPVAETPPEFEIVEPNPSYLRLRSEPSEQLDAFITLCGPERLYQLFHSLGATVQHGRLRYWQIQLLREFRNRTGHELAEDQKTLLDFLEPIEAVYELSDGST